MSAIVLIDTCVLLNILDVPGHNQDADNIRKEFKKLLNQADTLLLPMATILETGNHIADLTNGQYRRKWAKIFVELVQQTYRGEAPWSSIAFPELATIMPWLPEFPDKAMSKIGFSDLSIIKDWEKTCKRHPMSRVTIWSIDSAMIGYDRIP